MSLDKIFGISSSGMSAQQVRLNVTASNLANANQVSGDPNSVYKAKYPIFKTVMNQMLGANFNGEQNLSSGVEVTGIGENKTGVEKRFQPGHPLADKEGYVYASNVNPVDELANMISASRAYQDNVEISNTAKTLYLRTLDLLK